MWYQVGLKYVYDTPNIKVRNYRQFVETVSKGNYLGTLVRVLDLGNIVQSGKNSYTSRLLRRCSVGLQTFRAPQTSFGYAPLLSLRQCKNLRNLDLGLVSESVDLRELFQAIERADELLRLEFPRSSVFCVNYDFVWPKNLKYLGLAGGISDDFLCHTKFPETITKLSVSFCPFITSTSLRSLATRLGPHLTSLTVLYPIPGLRANTLDNILKLCPNLTQLAVSVDYISRHIFETSNMPVDSSGRPTSHPLWNLTLDSSGLLGQSHKIQADDIALSILEDKFPDLMIVRVSTKLCWSAENEDLKELIEVLEEREGGVYVF